MATYISNNEWAKRLGFSTLNMYNSDGNTSPNTTMLNALRLDAQALIDELIGSTVTTTAFLKRLEFEALQLMLDDNMDRTSTEAAIATSIREYIKAKNEAKLDSKDTNFNRTVTTG